MKITVGTRYSQLALRQSEPMVEFLKESGHEIVWRHFSTSGDRWLSGPLGKETGTGFFTRELEESLLAGEVDLLIHSFKDVALERPEGILTACVPQREDPADWLLMRRDAPSRPRIGTSSERRLRFLRQAMPEAEFTWIRGNVPTRVQRVSEGLLRDEPLHGTVLAAAGLRRLGLDLSGLNVRPLSFTELLPAPGQGALLAETRTDRQDLVEVLRGFHHPLTERCVRLERAVLAGIGGGCQQPLGAFAERNEEENLTYLRTAFAVEDDLRWSEAMGADEQTLLNRVLRGLGW